MPARPRRVAPRIMTPREWRRQLRRSARLGLMAMLPAIAFLLILAASRARLESPEPGLLLCDREGRFLGEIGADEEGGFGYWPLPGLPARVVAATLAVEDRRFHAHPGVDPLAAGRAAVQNLAR